MQTASFKYTGIILFLLAVPPIDELDDCLVDVVSRFRSGAMDRSEAKGYIEENKMDYIIQYEKDSREISEMMGSWARLAE